MGSGSGVAGGVVDIPITLTSLAGAQTAAVQWTLTYPADILRVTFTVGTAAVNADKTIACNGNTCIVYGMNATPIPDGIVATASLLISPNPSLLTIPIELSGIGAATPEAASIPASSAPGTLSVPPVATLSGLTCSLSTLHTPGSTQCTVSLTAPAQVGGSVVSISSNNLNLTVPSTVTVNSGQTSASFTAAAGKVVVDQTATITASLNGQNRSVTLNLQSLPVPTADSVSPSNGAGSTQTFTFVFSDSQSSANLSAAAMLFAPALVVQDSCYVIYDRNRGTIQLQWDDLRGNENQPVGSSKTLENSQCVIGATSVTATALSTTITLAITFKNAFAGLKNIYMYGADGDGLINTGWVQRGSYTVGTLSVPAPSVDSVTPASGSGVMQTFTFVVSDTQSSANLVAAAMLFAPTLRAENSCFVVYDRNRGTIQLEWDSVMGAEVKPVSSATTLQNSQCSIGATTVTTTALSTTITMDISFKSAFAGLENIYMYGADGDGSINTGWVQKGTYTVGVSSPPVPSVDSVSPSAGSGFVQTFTFVFSDSQSATNLSAAAVLFAPSLSYLNSCFVIYDRNRGTIQLEWDSVLGAASKPVSSTTTLQNSQCSIGATSVTASALSTTLTLDVTFKSAFTGLKNIYMYGADGDGSINTGWVQKGTYTVAVVSPPVPAVVSVSPSSGNGLIQTFTFVFSDSQSATNLSAAAVLFAPSISYPNSCFVIYDRNRGTIQLEWDNVMGAQIKPVSSSDMLQNSQCLIGATSVTTTAFSTSITLEIAFKSAFAGPKNIYMYSADGDGSINTGWVLKGTWTPIP
ncbi:MAG: hypothetical protein LAP61_29510 [Acidobacteriia bacterium]|nr:hypothetical protein [Terriglobia bacterium]